MKPKLTPAVRAYIKSITSKGGKARAEKYAGEQLSEWSKRGGRPRALDSEALARLRKLLSEGKTQSEISEQLGVSLSTVARAMKRDNEGNPASD
jgi:transposase